MAKISKESIIQKLETIGYEQHAANKNLYLLSLDEKQYGVDIRGKEPDVFRIDNGSERITDLNDDIVKNTINVLSSESSRAPPVDLEAEQEYCNATPEVSEDETATEIPQGVEVVPDEEPSEEYRKEVSAKIDIPYKGEVIKELPPSGSSEQTDEPYDDDFVNEEPPVEVVEPEYEEPEVKKTTQVQPIQQGVQILSCIQDMDLQLAEAGKIKIGKKRPPKTGQKASDFRAPMKLDHFLVTTTEFDPQTGDLKLNEKIMEKVGPNCRLLHICLPYDDINLNFQSSYARYTKTKCLCRGDGKTAKTDDGKIILCEPKTCQFAQDKQCKPTGILSVILEDAPSIGGVFKFRTTSWNSIRNISSSLHFITSKITGGVLAGIPLNMVLIPKTVQIPGGKGTTEIYMVNLEIPHSMSKMREMAREEAKLRAETLLDIRTIEANAAKQLAMQEPPSPEEIKEITAEFYPELHKKAEV